MWICDRVGSNYISFVCGMVVILVVVVVLLLVYFVVVVLIVLVVVCVWVVNVVMVRLIVVWVLFIVVVVGWNGCFSGGGVRMLSLVFCLFYWLVVVVICWILICSLLVFIFGKFNSEL